MLRTLSEPETRDLLATGRIGRLGCIFDDAPYVVPVCYIFRDNRIYVHSLLGRKIAALRANPHACLQVDEGRGEYKWSSAIAFGNYREVTDSVERDRIARELLERFPHLTPVESVPVHDGASTVVVFCIEVKRLSGVGEP